MTITYHSGRRIQGTSGDGVGNNTNTTQSYTSGATADSDVGGIYFIGEGANTTSSVFYNGFIKSVNFYAFNPSSNSGTCHAVQMDQDGQVVHTFWSKDMSTLGTSNGTMTTETSIPSNVKFGQYHSLGIWSTGNMKMGINLSGSFDGTNTTRITYTNFNGASATRDVSTGYDMAFNVVVGTKSSALDNVQVGSRFEETDTRKIYHYGTPVVFDDPTPTSSDYTNTGSSFTFASNKIHVDAVGYGSTLTMCTRPLTSSFVPTTDGCIIDFKFNWTTAGGSGNDTGVQIGLWDTRSQTNNTNNGICLEFVTSPTYARNVQYRCEGVFDNSSVQGYPVPDEYYCRIIVQKDGSSTGKGYTSESDRTADANAVFSRSTAAQTGFSSKTLFGLLNTRPTGGGNVIGDLDNMKVYTGLVVADTVWKEEGT